MCDATAKDGTVINVHIEPATLPCGIDKFKEGGGEKSGEDRGEGGALGGAVV